MDASETKITGHIHSTESFGAADGPGREIRNLHAGL